jgi:hypothetical protein
MCLHLSHQYILVALQGGSPGNMEYLFLISVGSVWYPDNGRKNAAGELFWLDVVGIWPEMITLHLFAWNSEASYLLGTDFIILL